MTLKRIHFTVHGGRVQGVFFRAHTVSSATKHNLTGWVHNLPSGNAVQGQAQGLEDELVEFLKEVDKGPQGAHVVRLEKTEIPLKEGEEGFRKVKSYETPPEH